VLGLDLPLNDMPRRGSPYGSLYERERTRILSEPHLCVLRLRCDGDVATTADHVPPLSLHQHVSGSGCCVLVPACLRCQKSQGGRLMRQLEAERKRSLPQPSRHW
jgi:5-methylcytosine-specific restriction endonuclease McrA